MSIIENKEIPSIIVGASLHHAMQKITENTTGEERKKLLRIAGQAVLDFLKENDIVKDRMTLSDVKHVFVDVLDLLDDLKIEDKENEIVFKLINPLLADCLREAYLTNTPVFCPYIGVIEILYSQINKTKLDLTAVEPQKEGNLELTFRKC